MNIRINNKDIPKVELLELVKKNKLQAIIFVRNITNIGLKDAKDIVDNLEKRPNYYDNLTITKNPREFIENERVIVKTKNHKDKGSLISKSKKEDSYFIKRNNTSNKYFVFGLFFLIVILVYFLLSDISF